MNASNVFEKNLQLFERLNPGFSERIKESDDPSLRFFQTEKGELNLEREVYGVSFSYHSSKGIQEEAQEWYKKHLWMPESTVYIYGLGLGYYYDVVQTWLKSHPDNVLIFLENDLGVLHRFLETEKATTLLLDSQVYVKAFRKPQHENDWSNLRKDLDEIFWAFAARKYFPTVSIPYEQMHAGFSQDLYTQLRINLMSTSDYFNEIFKWSLEQDFLNFYQNLIEIDKASYVQEFIHSFEGIPAIICGAGPSLNNELSLLKDLENKALIFAAGSALNVLSFHGVEAQFSSRLDPTLTQKSRLLSHSGFETPFFYVNRFSHEGFNLSHGKPLLIKWSDIYQTANWFEEKLGLKPMPDFETGISSANFALEIAYQLGCRPLILLGMDLCYSDEKVYAEGQFIHPTDSLEERRKLIPPEYKQIPFMSAKGEILQTRWDWVQEAGNYSLFHSRHPEARLINATLNKLPIAEVNSVPFKEVVNQELIRSYDLLNLIHTNIQLGCANKARKEDVLNLLKEWDRSLERCINLSDAELLKEPASIYLKKISEAFEFSVTFQKMLLRVHPEIFNSSLEVRLKEEIDQRRQQCLNTVIQKHRQYIKQALSSLEDNLKVHSKPLPEKIDQQGKYLFENTYELIEEELKIEFSEKIPEQIEKKEWHYRDKTLKGFSYYYGDLLHGPSKFYSKEGCLLAESWFIHGKRSGKTIQYYTDGQLASLQAFKNGKREGRQVYYYADGHLKSELNYKEGLLDGVVRLYFPHGGISRELHYRKGKLHGSERMWNLGNRLLLECFYQEGRPQGYARKWHENGQMAVQVMYYEDENRYDWWQWNESGELLAKHQQGQEEDLSKALESLSDLKKKMDLLRQGLQQNP